MRLSLDKPEGYRCQTRAFWAGACFDVPLEIGSQQPWALYKIQEVAFLQELFQLDYGGVPGSGFAIQDLDSA